MWIQIFGYGGTSGGVIAAVTAARLGKSVALVHYNNHLGGMTPGGLGVTDVGQVGSIGGFAREFYRRVGSRYGSAAPVYWFEPHVAESDRPDEHCDDSPARWEHASTAD